MYNGTLQCSDIRDLQTTKNEADRQSSAAAPVSLPYRTSVEATPGVLHLGNESHGRLLPRAAQRSAIFTVVVSTRLMGGRRRLGAPPLLLLLLRLPPPTLPWMML